jgi:molybdate transport system substrate-binding protein
MRLFTRFAAGLALTASAALAADLHVAAASNLNQVLPELSIVFERETQIHVVPSYGATAQLTQQAEGGAPWDVFLSADTEHVDQLVKENLVVAGSRAVYAVGKLVVWAPKRSDLTKLDQLRQPDVRFISVAKPELAPYGSAALDSLKSAGIWMWVFQKIVYAPSVAVAKEFADTGNAEAAFTALALVFNPKDGKPLGHYFEVSDNLHKPIDQALCILKSSRQAADAQKFVMFLKSPVARSIFERFGYGQP